MIFYVLAFLVSHLAKRGNVRVLMTPSKGVISLIIFAPLLQNIDQNIFFSKMFKISELTIMVIHGKLFKRS